ncbi:MAG: hypothetical protein RBS07_16925 [Lentimicrobium sp.]|jgi:hypothetical protein|nr:hypothetical protein [Lentimicrobium sp.]
MKKSRRTAYGKKSFFRMRKGFFDSGKKEIEHINKLKNLQAMRASEHEI